MRRQGSVAAAWFLALSALLVGNVWANGVIRDGVGAVSIGRGGTNIAFSDNAVVLLDNPAGIVGVDGSGRFDIGLDGLITDLYYADPFTADSAAVRPMGLPYFGLIRKCGDGDWAWGLTVAAPAGFGAHFNLDDPVFGRQAYTSFGALAKILPGVAYQVNDRLSIGATLGLGFSSAKLEGPHYLQTGMLQGAPTLVDMRANGACLVWSCGAQYALSERTTIGFAYQSESRVKMSGSAEVDVLAPFPLSSEFDAEVKITWPRSFGVGMVHTMGDRHRFSSDLIWIGWSSAFDTMGMTLSDPTNPLVSQLLGPTLGDEFPFHWNDSLSIRLGYEFALNECTVLRTGYVYNVNQVPDGTLTPYIPAILEHGFSAGLGRTWGTCSLDLAYQYSFGPERTVGTSDLVGGDFDNSVFRASAHWLSAAFTKRF